MAKKNERDSCYGTSLNSLFKHFLIFLSGIKGHLPDLPSLLFQKRRFIFKDHLKDRHGSLVMELRLGRISRYQANASHQLLDQAIVQALIRITLLHPAGQLQQCSIGPLRFTQIGKEYRVIADLGHTVMVARQAVFLQQLRPLLHMDFGKTQAASFVMQRA